MEIYYDVGDHLGDFRALGLEGCDFVGGLDCGKQRQIDGGCELTSSMFPVNEVKIVYVNTHLSYSWQC